MERPQTTLYVSLLAKEFHRLVREALTPSELVYVDKANETMRAASSTCATHDYIDSNEDMTTAFDTVMDRQIDFENDDDLQLWNIAWGLAQCNGFSKDWDDRPRAG